MEKVPCLDVTGGHTKHPEGATRQSPAHLAVKAEPRLQLAKPVPVKTLLFGMDTVFNEDWHLFLRIGFEVFK